MYFLSLDSGIFSFVLGEVWFFFLFSSWVFWDRFFAALFSLFGWDWVFFCSDLQCWVVCLVISTPFFSFFHIFLLYLYYPERGWSCVRALLACLTTDKLINLHTPSSCLLGGMGFIVCSIGRTGLFFLVFDRWETVRMEERWVDWVGMMGWDDGMGHWEMGYNISREYLPAFFFFGLCLFEETEDEGNAKLERKINQIKKRFFFPGEDGVTAFEELFGGVFGGEGGGNYDIGTFGITGQRSGGTGVAACPD
jgi:hypothetical protein